MGQFTLLENKAREETSNKEIKIISKKKWCSFFFGLPHRDRNKLLEDATDQKITLFVSRSNNEKVEKKEQEIFL